jgi:hypothetical protein
MAIEWKEALTFQEYLDGLATLGRVFEYLSGAFDDEDRVAQRVHFYAADTILRTRIALLNEAEAIYGSPLSKCSEQETGNSQQGVRS